MSQKFQQWFTKKLTVGSYPYHENVGFSPKLYDVIINVSDEYYPEIDENHTRTRLCQVHWFAMSEFKKDMGLNSIYAAIIILWYAEQKGDNVYLHCHSGSNRSWTVAAAYYFFRTGAHLDKSTKRGYINKLHQNCAEGMLPPILEMERFLLAVREDLKDDKMKNGILSMAKVNTIVNF